MYMSCEDIQVQVCRILHIIVPTCVAGGHAENAHDHGQKRQIYAWALAWAALWCGRLYE